MEALHTLQKKEEVRALHCGVKLGLVTMNPAKDGKEMDLIGWSFTSTTCHVEVWWEREREREREDERERQRDWGSDWFKEWSVVWGGKGENKRIFFVSFL
jgi:hypothetical protein